MGATVQVRFPDEPKCEGAGQVVMANVERIREEPHFAEYPIEVSWYGEHGRKLLRFIRREWMTGAIAYGAATVLVPSTGKRPMKRPTRPA